MFNEYDLSFPDSDMNEYVSWKDKVPKGGKSDGSGQKSKHISYGQAGRKS